jgi:uncharacterized protein YjiS (DUF1127 family)
MTGTVRSSETVVDLLRFLPAPISRTPASALMAWLDLCRQRAALATLDDRLLADVGLTRDAAEAEARKWL